jgi:hypothetical protein
VDRTGVAVPYSGRAPRGSRRLEAFVPSEKGDKLATVELSTSFESHGPEYRAMVVQMAASVSFEPPALPPEAGSKTSQLLGSPMTIDVPIRPGAALSDPETRQFVEEHILNASYDFSDRYRKIPELAYNKDGLINVLANFPWQEYGYKKGRWQREPLSWEVDFLPFRVWEKVYRGFLLSNPATGQEISEVRGAVSSVVPPSGRLPFAGNPQYAGVMNTVVDGERRIYVVGSIRLARDPESATEIARRASELVQTMVPERPPQAQLFDLPPKYLERLGPWQADHPDKTSRRS